LDYDTKWSGKFLPKHTRSVCSNSVGEMTKTNVCVVGIGRIGLALALLLAKAGHRVFGVEINPQTLRKLRGVKETGKNFTPENMMLHRFLDKRLFLTEDLHVGISRSEAVFIAIGTGISSDGKPELSTLFNLVEDICSKPGDVSGRLFVLKSTLPVGTTREIVSVMEQRTGMQCGKDFFVAFCPERVLGDKALSEMASLPKIIGGYDKKSSRKAAKIYRTIGGKIIVAQSPEMAELIKLVDNAYRQTRFAFANDLALLAEHFKLNAYELVKMANDSYSRNDIPFPSGGVSGYCLTKDPLYLERGFSDVAIKRGFPSVWFSARKANDYMPVHMIDLLKQALSRVGKGLEGSNILICGIAYKENTEDIRSSHGLEIASRLRGEGAKVFLWDPCVHEKNLQFPMVNNPEEALTAMDALVLTVKHREFIKMSEDPKIIQMIRNMRTPIVVDGWGVFQKLSGKKGILYMGIGFPNE